MLYRYIFYKVYLFYIKIFKEKEIPHWFAAGIVAVLMVGTFQVLIDFYSYFFNQEIIGLYTSYNKYLVLLLGFLLMLYVSKQNRYLRIIEACEKLPKRKRKLLGFVGIVYVISLFIGFFWIGTLIRELNM